MSATITSFKELKAQMVEKEQELKALREQLAAFDLTEARQSIAAEFAAGNISKEEFDQQYKALENKTHKSGESNKGRPNLGEKLSKGGLVNMLRDAEQFGLLPFRGPWNEFRKAICEANGLESKQDDYYKLALSKQYLLHTINSHGHGESYREEAEKSGFQFRLTDGANKQVTVFKMDMPEQDTAISEA